jgi:hypothetical protein
MAVAFSGIAPDVMSCGKEGLSFLYNPFKGGRLS